MVFDYASDYDQDGLLDAWERERLGSLAQGADDDPDEDGITNLGEQRAGTNPLDSDSDGDLVEDGWEVRHLMDPANMSDASDNPDNDPFDNSKEFIADTDPHDPNDYLYIAAINGSLPMIVYFNSSTNRLYTLLGSSNLVNGAWDDVPGAGPRRGVGGADSIGDTNEPPRGPFYRLNVKLP